MIELLLAAIRYGADPERCTVSSASAEACDHNGNTALHVAVIHGRLGWVAALLRAGASPVITNNIGRKPIDIETTLPEIIKYLAAAARAQPYTSITCL